RGAASGSFGPDGSAGDDGARQPRGQSPHHARRIRGRVPGERGGDDTNEKVGDGGQEKGPEPRSNARSARIHSALPDSFASAMARSNESPLPSIAMRVDSAPRSRRA